MSVVPDFGKPAHQTKYFLDENTRSLCVRNEGCQKTHQTGLPKVPYIFRKDFKKDDPRHLHLSSPTEEQETKSIE